MCKTDCCTEVIAYKDKKGVFHDSKEKCQAANDGYKRRAEQAVIDGIISETVKLCVPQERYSSYTHVYGFHENQIHDMIRQNYRLIRASLNTIKD